MQHDNCSIDGCADLAKGREPHGYCARHQRHWKQFGDPLSGEFRPYRRLTHEQRFWTYVQKTPDCWIWTGPTRGKKSPYGRFQVDGEKVAAHRFSYELHVGPIPEGLYLDHTCHNPPCVNPAHLRPVTSKQNQENQAGVRVDNTSGYRGVTLDRKIGKWRGGLHHAGKRIIVGWFSTPEEAHVAVRAKRIELFTHNDADRETA